MSQLERRRHSFPTGQADRLDSVCDRFESAWRAGGRPRLEDFVQQVEEPDRPALLEELLHLELHYRARNQENVREDEYRTRLPQFATLIDDVFGNLSRATRAASSAAPATPPAAEPNGAGRNGPEPGPEPGQADGPAVPGYKILARLGAGGMGIVYRAFDLELHREVALKMLRSEHAARPQARERFLREARAMAALQHDHVVPIHHVGEVDAVPYLVMPLLRGETLADRLDRTGLLPAAEVLRLGREIAEGLAAVHGAGLIHRDLKPDNVWLEESSRVKLLDLGLARDPVAASELSGASAVIGTPAYMSPEQANGEPLDGRSDLFSLGSVLYECATGQRAFVADTLTAVLVAVAEKDPPAARQVNPEVSPALSALIERLLAKRREARPASALAVVEMIRALETQPETLIRSAAPAGRAAANTRKPRQRTIGCSVTVTICTMMFVSAVVVLLAYNHFKSRHQPSDWERPGPDTQPVNRVGTPLKADLEIAVEKQRDPATLLDIAAPGALPLRPGDRVRVQVESNRPAYFYVIYLNTRGEAVPWFPWRGCNWNDRSDEQARSQLELPAARQELKLAERPSGIEAVLMLAREDQFTASEVARLRQFLAAPPPLGKFQPLRGAVWLGAEERFTVPADRARRSQDQPGMPIDPVERVRQLLRGELKALVGDKVDDRRGDVRGACFAFDAK